MTKIFILHGWTYSVEKWIGLLQILKEKGFDPVMLNVPGLTTDIDRAWTLEDYTSWLDGIFKKEQGPYNICGHSNGGRIACAYAALHPDRISSLILIDSSGIYHNELPIRAKRYIFRSLATFAKKITKSEILRNFLYKLTGESDYYRAKPIMRQTMFNLIRSDITPSLELITAPTTIIWGRSDTTTPLSDAYVFCSKIKNSKLVILDGAFHSPYFTHTVRVSTIIANAVNNV